MAIDFGKGFSGCMSFKNVQQRKNSINANPKTSNA
jgi:hypothetical protein